MPRALFPWLERRRLISDHFACTGLNASGQRPWPPMARVSADLDKFRARLLEAQQKQADLLAELEESRQESQARHSLLETAIRAQQTAIRGLQEGLDDLYRGDNHAEQPESWTEIPTVPAGCVRAVASSNQKDGTATPPGERNVSFGGADGANGGEASAPTRTGGGAGELAADEEGKPANGRLAIRSTRNSSEGSHHTHSPAAAVHSISGECHALQEGAASLRRQSVRRAQDQLRSFGKMVRVANKHAPPHEVSLAGGRGVLSG